MIKLILQISKDKLSIVKKQLILIKLIKFKLLKKFKKAKNY